MQKQLGGGEKKRLQCSEWTFPGHRPLLWCSLWEQQSPMFLVFAHYVRSIIKDNCPQLVGLVQADGCYGAIVELERRPSVHHHAGVPAARPHTHPAGKAPLAAVGEHSVDDGLPDAEEQLAVLRVEDQMLIILVCDIADKIVSERDV